MLRPVRQQITAVLAVCAVLGLALLPTEHVHVTRTHDGHHSDLVHRHFEPHHRLGTQTSVDHADDDGDVQWLSVSFTSSASAAHVYPDPRPVDCGLSTSQPELTLHGTIQALFVSVHDPPWATPSGLRAPPASRL